MPTWPVVIPPQQGTVNPPGTVDDGNLFGTDLYYVDNLEVGPDGDYLTIYGVENLRRAVLRRLMTRPGEYRLNPSYGVGILDFVKKPLTSSNLNTLKNRISENLLRDRRIDKVIELTLTPTVFTGGIPGLTVVVVVQAKGAVLTFQPFTFRRGQ